MKNTVLKIYIFILFALILAGCMETIEVRPYHDGLSDYEGMERSISTFVQSNENNFSKFSQLMIAGDLERTLKAYNPNGNNYTLFLPSDQAFEEFIATSSKYQSFEDLLADEQYVRTLVRYHVLNSSYNSNDFPFGAFPDTTLSGNLLTVSYTGETASLIQSINNYAEVIGSNIRTRNGLIHLISKVLQPVVLNSYEWLNQNPEYTIISKALELTGLKDSLSIRANGEYPTVTMLVESDKVYYKRGIHSINDLINLVSPVDDDYTLQSNGLFQFTAYHLLVGVIFLNNLEGVNTNYNTYGSLPIAINGIGIDIKINTGASIFDTIITNQDTTYINFIRLDYDQSNVLTMNGAIHFISEVMKSFRPSPNSRRFQFYEEPLILAASRRPNTYLFQHQEDFSYIKWERVKEIKYTKSATTITGTWDNDYIELEGDFSITYRIPKVLPGKYMLRIRTHSNNQNNAFIQVFLNGKSMGAIIDQTSYNLTGGYRTHDIGQVNFTNYSTHEIRIESIIPGRLIWDGVELLPVQ